MSLADLQQWGCPLCRAIWTLDATRFSWYVNDGVLDEETLRSMIHSQGCSTLHTLFFVLLEGNNARSFLLPFPTGPPHTS